MTLKTLPGRSRSGFTLIELLVVIAIIAILVALLMSGIWYAYIRMQDTGSRNDISQMQDAMQQFKAKYGAYPPQRIRLCRDRSMYSSASPAAYGGAKFDNDSVAFLNRIWPNLGNFTNMDWAGARNVNPASPVPAIDEILEGDQVLVFFLGGIPHQINGTYMFTGFASNSKDPTLPASANVGRIKSFFTFESSRCKPLRSANFPSYYDYYGQTPYVYFSANNRTNGYNPYPNPALNLPDNFGSPITVPNYKGGGSATLMPYYSAVGKYQKADTFQIHGAGRNGNFNTIFQDVTISPTQDYPNAFLWTPAIVSNLSLAGTDDFTNVSDTRMGVPQ